MAIKPIESRVIWEGFLAEAQPNTFLHSWEWGEFNRAMGDRIWRLGIYDNDILCAIALIVRVRAKRGAFLFCPHGPIVGDRGQGLGASIETVRVLTQYLVALAKKEKCSFIRFSPLMLKTPDHEKVWQGLGFREAPIHMHPELAWILDITPSAEELLKAMRKTTRYSIRKAEKDGVQVTMSTNPEDVEKFWSVYSATVDRQHFVPFSKQYLRTEFEVFAKQGSAALFFGIYRGEIISAAFVLFQSWSAFYHHGASDPTKYTNIPVSQLVQWHAILEAKRRGCARYNFWGIAPENKPHHPWAGLTLFKKGFSGSSEEYVHAKDFPLTPRYWINYAIESIRKHKRRL